MDDSLSECISIQDCLNCNQKKLRRINNVRVLLEKKYFAAKQTVEDTLNLIKDKFVFELEDVVSKKLEALQEMERLVKEHSVMLVEAGKNPDSKKILQLMECAVPADARLLPYLSLDFVPDEIQAAKSCLGYIKSSPIKLQDLILNVKNEVFKIGNDLVVSVDGGQPWYPLLINSLSADIEHPDGQKKSGLIKDNEDGSYLITFRLEHYGSCIVSVTLYGRHIQFSPTTLQIECFKTETIKTETKEDLLPRNPEHLLANSSNRGNAVEGKRLKPEDEMDVEAKGNCLPYGESSQNYFRRNSPLRGKHSPVKAPCNYQHHETDLEPIAVTGELMAKVDKSSGVNLFFPIGVAVTPKNDIIICDTGHHMVWLLDEFGRKKVIINNGLGSQRLVRPSAVEILSDGTFAIKDNNGLHLYDQEGSHIRTMGTQLLKRPFGLAITRDDKLVTLNEIWTPNLCVFNKNGELEEKNLLEPLIQKKEGSKCRFMASYENQVVISDLGLSKIYKTTLKGKTILSFGRYGRSEGAMVEPSGITLDPKGTMLIGDSKNDRVQIFDWDGDYLGSVKFSHPIRRPSDITMTKDGRLFVLNYLDHHLSVYRLSVD